MSNRFPSGVSHYLTATATIEVHFPIDKDGTALVNCNLCPFFRYSSQRCGINGEAIAFPTKYVGMSCPLEAGEVKENDT